MLFGNFNVKKIIFFYSIFLSLCSQQMQGQDSLSIFSKQISIYFKKGQQQKSDSIFKKKLFFLQNKDNQEEEIYAYLDYFLLQPTNNRISIISNLEEKLLRKPQSQNEKLALLHLWVNHAYYLKKQGDIYQSIIHYEKALSYYDKQKLTYNILDFCLKPLANNCTRIGDYQRADDLMIRSLQIAILAKDNKQIIAFSNNLAISKQSQGHFKLAIDILQKTLQTPTITAIQKSRAHSELAKNFYKIQDYTTALVEVEKAISCQKNIQKKEQKIIVNCYTTKGLCFIALHKLDKANKVLEIAIKLARKTYQNQDREIAKIDLLFAEIATLNKDYKSALSYYQKSLKTLLSSYQPNDLYENPKPESFFPENTLKEALDGRAKIFTLQLDYINALKNYDLSFIQETILRETYTSQKAKIIQQNENRKRSSQVITLCHKLYAQTSDKHYILKAFNYAEKTKSLVLLDEIQNKNKHYQSDSLFTIQKELAFQKALLSKEIQVAIQQNSNNQKIEKDIVKRSELTNKLQLIKQKIKLKYPSTITYEIKDFDVNYINKTILKENKVLIEYFVGDVFTSIFKISKDGISWRRIENTLYDSLLQDFFLFFSEDNGSRIVNNIEGYKELALSIYNRILAPELQENSQTKLLIIPDGILSFIPFDALLTQKNDSNIFQKIPFLIKEQEVSYGYSVSIISQEKKNNNFKNKLVGFFPQFTEKQRGLSQLPYTVNEKEFIKKYLPINIFEKEKATKQTFIEQAKENRIIHLSTHANTKNLNKLSAIEFWDEPLFLTELYGHQINAELVVLSACETGIGKTKKGEGAMSLARGFSYAGVSNLVVSLWNVNDKATSILMGDFYKYLSKEKIATEALHTSKLSYLQNKEISNTKKSPFYWASFIPIKNTVKPFIEVKRTNFVWVYFMLFFVVIALYFSFKSKL